METGKLELVILDQVKESLPEATAQVLSDYLKKASEAFKELEGLKKIRENLSGEHEKNESLRSELSSIVEERNRLKKQEEEILKKEREIKVTLAEMRADAAEIKAEAIHNLVSSLFRNIEYRRSMYGNVPKLFKKDDYDTIETTGTNQDTTETAE